MTPTQLETAARQRYNAVGDDFYPTAMIYDLIYEAAMDLATETRCIKNIYTSDSVASQAEYEKPTNAIGVIKVLYNERELLPISLRERQGQLVGSSYPEGTPCFYTLWGDSVFLTPTPVTAVTSGIKMYTYDQATAISVSSVLTVPERYHIKMVDFIIAHMHGKDNNRGQFEYYMNIWQDHVKAAKKFERKMNGQDRMAHVHDIESDPYSFVGR